MGWLFMRSVGGHAGPRAYLDAQFTYENERARSRVLRSALVRMRTWYAAVELVRPESGEREVYAAVCLVRWNPRDREGYIFGYKDMDESLGPCEAECPKAILDLLTPTSEPYAIAWRDRCRAHLTRRREFCTVQKPKPGQVIVFDAPIRFADGRSFDRMLVVADPNGRRCVRFRDPQGGGTLYRIGQLAVRPYRLFEASAIGSGPAEPSVHSHHER